MIAKQNFSFSLVVDEAQLNQLAKPFAQLLTLSVIGLNIYLYGELGAGKTTFVRAILQALGYHDKIKSPTYTLVEEYQIADKKFFHFDLYRLSSAEELEYIGIRDYVASNICFFEWPDQGKPLIPVADIIVQLDYLDSVRKITFVAQSKDMSILLQQLQQQILNL